MRQFKLRIGIERIDFGQVSVPTLITDPSLTITATINGVAVVLSDVGSFKEATIPLDGTYGLVDIVDNGGPVPLVVTATYAGYESYSNTFEIYGYDLTFNVVLMEEDVLDTTSSILEIKNPVTKEIRFYDLTSGRGITTWKKVADSSILSSARNFVLTGDNVEDVFLTKSLGTFDRDSTPSNIGTYKTGFPAFSIVFNDGEGEFTSEVSDNEVKSFIDYEGMDTYNVDDVVTYLSTEDVLTVNVFDSLGAVIATQTFNITVDDETQHVSPPGDIWLPSDPGNIVNFTTGGIGDYVVEGKLESFDSNSTLIRSITVPIAIVSTSYFEILQDPIDTCNYTLYNRATEAIVVTVSELQDDGTFLQTGTINMPASSEQLVTLTDGVYQYSADRSGDINIKIVVSDCEFKENFENLLIDVLCGKECCCTLNKVIPVSHLYFTKLHDEYVNNYFYEAIDSNKLDELFTLKKLQLQLDEYFRDKSRDCGCGCS